MPLLPLTMACGPYDRMQALELGIIQPEGVLLRYLPIQSSPEIFARMIKTRSFDVSEMSLAHYMIMRSQNDFPFIAIPIFPSRVFRHGYIFVNKNAGIREPRDLEGKRVGVQEYRQTAGVWVRGILKHEYSVDLDTVHYLEGGVNEPRGPDQELDLRPTGPLSLELIAKDRTLNDMLERGEIDAYFGARRPAALDRGRNVARLFPDYRAREKEYFQRTRFHPIMHTLVIREDLHRAEPWVAESLFKACVAAKKWGLQQMRHSGAQRFMLPWLFDEIAEMDAIMGDDPWPYGLEANREILTAFLQYLVEQRYLKSTPPLDELFAPIVAWTE